MAGTSASDMPNYRYGVDNVVLALYNSSNGNYGGIWYEAGAESVEESGSSSVNTATFYSDNGKPVNVSGAASGEHTLNVQFAELSEQYQTKVLGHTKDSTTGAIIKKFDDPKATFAMGFQVQGTSKKTKVWKFGCVSNEPTATFQSVGENVTEAPQSATITVNGDPTRGYEIVCHEGDAGFETFLESVPSVSAAASGE